MKIAICFYGKFTGVNNRGDIQGFETPFKSLKENILSENADIFLHGWDDNEDDTKKLIDLVKPKKYIVEKQIVFNHPYNHLNFIPSGAWDTKRHIDNNYSRFYSLKQSVSLVDETYDLIMISRFDTVYYEPIDFTMLDPKNFYVTHWNLNHEGWGFNDGWFISGNENMKKYCDLYDNLDKYFNIENSDYVNYLKAYGLGMESLPSGHALWRYRVNEIGLTDKIYAFGLEYETWGLLRRFGLRNNPWGRPNVDIRTTTKI
jgi:hypothetical protein